MRVFKTRWFERFARSEVMSDDHLANAIVRVEAGFIDADLGGGLIKQRVARQGKGRSGGFRVLIAYRAADRAVFLFGFAKSERENVKPDELRDLKAFAADLLALDGVELDEQLAAEKLVEVGYDEES